MTSRRRSGVNPCGRLAPARVGAQRARTVRPARIHARVGIRRASVRARGERRLVLLLLCWKQIFKASRGMVLTALYLDAWLLKD
jgi:hypothetical protein